MQGGTQDQNSTRKVAGIAENLRTPPLEQPPLPPSQTSISNTLTKSGLENAIALLLNDEELNKVYEKHRDAQPADKANIIADAVKDNGDQKNIDAYTPEGVKVSVNIQDLFKLKQWIEINNEISDDKETNVVDMIMKDDLANKQFNGILKIDSEIYKIASDNSFPSALIGPDKIIIKLEEGNVIKEEHLIKGVTELLKDSGELIKINKQMEDINKEIGKASQSYNALSDEDKKGQKGEELKKIQADKLQISNKLNERMNDLCKFEIQNENGSINMVIAPKHILNLANSYNEISDKTSQNASVPDDLRNKINAGSNDNMKMYNMAYQFVTNFSTSKGVFKIEGDFTQAGIQGDQSVSFNVQLRGEETRNKFYGKKLVENQLLDQLTDAREYTFGDGTSGNVTKGTPSRYSVNTPYMILQILEGPNENKAKGIIKELYHINETNEKDFKIELKDISLKIDLKMENIIRKLEKTTLPSNNLDSLAAKYGLLATNKGKDTEPDFLKLQLDTATKSNSTLKIDDLMTKYNNIVDELKKFEKMVDKEIEKAESPTLYAIKSFFKKVGEKLGVGKEEKSEDVKATKISEKANEEKVGVILDKVVETKAIEASPPVTKQTPPSTPDKSSRPNLSTSNQPDLKKPPFDELAQSAKEHKPKEVIGSHRSSSTISHAEQEKIKKQDTKSDHTH